MFHIGMAKGGPPLPEGLSPECRDFLNLCFNRCAARCNLRQANSAPQPACPPYWAIHAGHTCGDDTEHAGHTAEDAQHALSGVSGNADRVISAALGRNPKERPNAARLLKHPFLQSAPRSHALATPLTNISIEVDGFGPPDGPAWRPPAGPVSPVPEEVRCPTSRSRRGQAQ